MFFLAITRLTVASKWVVRSSYCEGSFRNRFLKLSKKTRKVYILGLIIIHNVVRVKENKIKPRENKVNNFF